MDKELTQLFDESIRLELNVAALYKIFGAAFPDDSFFWRRLAMEEENYAGLLKSGKNRFEPLGKFPLEILPSSTEELESVNSSIKNMIKKYEKTPPSREEAFNLALELEQSAGELHFQQFMEKESPSELEKIFQRLNRDDKDHIEKIRLYMEAHDITPS